MAAQTRLNYENLSELVFDKDVGKGIIYKETKSIDKEWKERKVLEFNTFEIKFHSFMSTLKSLLLLLIVDENATREFYEKYRYVIDEDTGKPYIDARTGKKITLLSEKEDYYYIPEYSRGWVIGRIQSNGKIKSYTKSIQTSIRDLFEIKSLNIDEIFSSKSKQKKQIIFSLASKVADKLVVSGLYFGNNMDKDEKQSSISRIINERNFHIKHELESLFNSQLRCMALLQKQIDELTQRVLKEPEKRELFEFEIKTKRRQLMNYESVEKPVLNKIRKLVADYAVMIPLSMQDAEFHDGYITFVLSQDRIGYGFIDEFGKEEDIHFTVGNTITIECSVSAWLLNDFKEDVLNHYGKDNLWVWVKRDYTGTMNNKNLESVLKEFNKSKSKSFIKKVDENLYEMLPSAEVDANNNQYIRFLVDNQSKGHKILSFDEIRIVNKKPFSEKAYIFTIPISEDFCLIIWENSNAKRSSIVFMSSPKASFIALGAIYQFANSNLKNKREMIMRGADELFSKYGLNSHYRVTHVSFDTWKHNLFMKNPSYHYL